MLIKISFEILLIFHLYGRLVLVLLEQQELLEEHLLQSST
jgi:hypothetical protein